MALRGQGPAQQRQPLGIGGPPNGLRTRQPMKANHQLAASGHDDDDVSSTSSEEGEE